MTGVSSQWVAFTILGVTVVNNLRGGFARPGYQAHGSGVRGQHHVRVSGFDEIPVIIGILPSDRLNQYTFRQTRLTAGQELVCRYELTAGITRDVRHQALHLGDLVLLQPILDGLRIGVHKTSILPKTRVSQQMKGRFKAFSIPYP